jgi:predicted DNA-binding transcriptional regulator AlpA
VFVHAFGSSGEQAALLLWQRTDRFTLTVKVNGLPAGLFRELTKWLIRNSLRRLRRMCNLNSIGRNTGKRLIATGDGPAIVQLSPRRIGIRESDAAAWQAARIRGRA